MKLNFPPQMQFMLLFSRQGKLRLQKWYVPLSDKERKKISRDLVQTILARKPKMCSFLEWRDLKIVYKRYVNKIILNTGCDNPYTPSVCLSWVASTKYFTYKHRMHMYVHTYSKHKDKHAAEMPSAFSNIVRRFS